MQQSNQFRVPKWPFFIGDAFMLGAAYFIFQQGKAPLAQWETLTIGACVALAALFGILPFILEYKGTVRLLDSSAVGNAAEKIQDLDRVSTQIANATAQWEVTQQAADKTAATASGIAERMAAEVQEFNQFLARMNDTEKSTLRLEVEKLRRAEGEWVHIVVGILDHVFALHTASLRSGQEHLIKQIGGFQNACRDTARRAGLLGFGAKPGEPFNAEKFKWSDGDIPAEGSVVSEMLAPGYTFQGRQIRPALVRVKQAEPATEPTAHMTTASGQTQLPIGTSTPAETGD